MTDGKSPIVLADELEAAALDAAGVVRSRGMGEDAQKYGKILVELVLDNLPAIIAALRAKAKDVQ